MSPLIHPETQEIAGNPKVTEIWETLSIIEFPEVTTKISFLRKSAIFRDLYRLSYISCNSFWLQVRVSWKNRLLLVYTAKFLDIPEMPGNPVLEIPEFWHIWAYLYTDLTCTKLQYHKLKNFSWQKQIFLFCGRGS